MISKDKIIKAIGEYAYQNGQDMIQNNEICPYDEETPVQEQLEERGKCFHCLAEQCPINK